MGRDIILKTRDFVEVTPRQLGNRYQLVEVLFPLSSGSNNHLGSGYSGLTVQRRVLDRRFEGLVVLVVDVKHSFWTVYPALDTLRILLVP
jgi:hypothetical protein